MYTEPTSIGEITRRLERLEDHVQLVFDSLGGNHIEINGIFTDVRAAELMNCKSDIGINIGILNTFVEKEQGRMTEDQLRKLLGFHSREVPFSLLEMRILQYLRLSLTTMLQFRIENMITNILAMLDKEQARKGYYKKVEALLDILKLQDKERKLKILNLLQFIRNSLHSGGVVNRNELEITVDGCRFSFRKGQQVMCAGWGHIAVAMEHSMIVLKEILHSQKVKAIPEPISVVYIEPDPEQTLTDSS